MSLSTKDMTTERSPFDVELPGISLLPPETVSVVEEPPMKKLSGRSDESENCSCGEEKTDSSQPETPETPETPVVESSAPTHLVPIYAQKPMSVEKQTFCDDVARAYVAHVTSEGQRNLCFFTGRWWRFWRDSGWREDSKENVEAVIMEFSRKAIRKNRLTEDLTATKRSSIILNVRDMLTVKPTETEDVTPVDTLDTSVWLDFMPDGITSRPAPGWVACRTHFLNVEKVACLLYEKWKAREDLFWEDFTPDMFCPADTTLFTRGMIPCDFNPAAKCPRWRQFVKESCRADARELQMMFGLTFTFIARYNVFFLVYGKAGTGKSTAMNILKLLHQGTVCSVSLGSFGERFQTFALTENRLNLVPDMESIFEGGTATKREGFIKAISGKEAAQVEQKFMSAETRNLIAWCVFTSNTFPRFSERTDAIRDRMRMLRFPRSFRGTEKQDPFLDQKLTAELPGILIWSLLGLGELLCEGHVTFPESASAREEKEEAIKAAQPVKLFCDAMLVCGSHEEEDVYAETEKIMAAYNEFCRRSNYHAAGIGKVIPEIVEYLGLKKQSRKKVAGKKVSVLSGVVLRESSTKDSQPE